MSYSSIPIWKEAPFIRLITPLITGILIEWHLELYVWIYKILIPVCLILIVLISFLGSYNLFKNYWLGGILINILFINAGGLITYYHDLRHERNCITHLQQGGGATIVTLTEPLSEKPNSFKANAAVSQVFDKDSFKVATGNIVVYVQKDSSSQQLAYNSRLVIYRKLQPIKNSGNPGAFDYQRYCIFQQTFFQVYLKTGDYELLPATNDFSFNRCLFTIRKKIVTILQTYIIGGKEAGLAEALLIGYKDDLDKNLVQSYSNTGVVHIIAISGLHVGLIYWLLNLLFKPLRTKRRMLWIQSILVIAGLWLFSILTGGSASVCRSALMFSFIVTGENMGRKTDIYNSLAASAFLLLCYNPYWLWDAGFQLSYIAVLSIIVFVKPVYNWFYVKNKLLDHIWKMAAISIAAQILTTPVSIFHFQQFPNYFLITNLVAVPLSSIIVLAELALCMLSFAPLLATPCGKVTFRLIKLMDDFISYINEMPYTITSDVQLSLVQLILIYLAICFAGAWMFQKNKSALIVAISFICCFCILKSYYGIKASSQYKLVIYNIPHHKAIDLIKGSRCLFIGDSAVWNDLSLDKFVFKPSRIKYRVKAVNALPSSPNRMQDLQIGTTHLLIIDSNINLEGSLTTCAADIVILSGTTNITLQEVQEMTHCKQIILDSTTSEWKANKWKTDCEKAGMAFYSVAEKGAFILNLN